MAECVIGIDGAPELKWRFSGQPLISAARFVSET
jgi:hypothetical protein